MAGLEEHEILVFSLAVIFTPAGCDASNGKGPGETAPQLG
jgi:hypothetical protein